MADELDTDALPPHERTVLERTRTASTLFDEAIRVPGTDYRIGLDPIIGLLPVSGDAAGAALSLYIVAESARLDVPKTTLGRMLVNVAIDAGGGSIPLVGGLFDFAWKANERNVSLLEDHLADRAGISVE